MHIVYESEQKDIFYKKENDDNRIYFKPIYGQSYSIRIVKFVKRWIHQDKKQILKSFLKLCKDENIILILEEYLINEL
ncbi:MAG: hypothetical protein H7836_14155 [Magnetococcus sp. YQC-3]